MPTKTKKKKSLKIKKNPTSKVDLYKSFFENLPHSAFQKDLQGKFILANSNFCKSLGNPLKKILGKTDFDFYSKALAEKYISDDKKVIKTGKVFEDIEEHQTSNGKISYVHVLKTPVFNSSGKVTGIQCIFWDVKKFSSALKESEEKEKRLQAQLIQSEKLSSIGLLGAGVAHELNSPLTGILTFLRLRRQDAKGNEKEYEKLTAMIEAGEHMAKIINDLTAFSRESEESNFSELNLNEIINSTLSFSSQQLLKQEIEIKKNYGKDIFKVWGNKIQLQQVILNLITNACHSMPEGGEFTINTYNSQNRKMVFMQFLDTGTGIKESDLNRIYDPFFTTKEQGVGTGLGLFVSKGIIEKHNGTIEAQSTLNKGSIFTISLPVRVKR